MFANLTYDDKVAFFDLLDEYFESRPHLLSGGSRTSNAPSPIAPISSNSRTLPPMAPPLSANRAQTPSYSPAAPPSRSPAPGGEAPDMATKFIMGGLKMGASGARTGLGMLSKNQAAMDALGKVGAAAMVNSAHGQLNKAGGAPQQQQQQQQQVPSPISPTNSYGQAPPSRGAPPRRTPSAQAAPAPADMAQARAMYDYEGADASDLTVQKGQVIYVSAKTSDDWWTCEDANGRKGLVPSAYLKEL